MNIYLKKGLLNKLRYIAFFIGISVIAVMVSYAINLKMFVWVSAIFIISIGIVVFLKNSEDLFWVFIFLLPFTNIPLKINIERLSIQFSQALILVIAVLYFFHAVAKKDKTVKLPKTPIDLALLIFVMINILSIYQSCNIPADYGYFVLPTIRSKLFIKSITQVMLFVPGILSYYVTVIFLRNRESIIKTIKVWLFTMGAVSLFGLYEFIGYYLKLPFANYFTNSWNFRHFGSLPILRVSSVSLEPIFLSVYIISTLPLAVTLFFSKINLIKRRYLLMITILSSILCFIFTLTSTSIIIILSVCISAVYLMRSRNPRLCRKTTIIASIIILIILVLFHNLLFQKLKFFFDTSSYTHHISAFHRIVCWKTAFNMFLRHPLLGVGIGNFDFNFLNNIPSLDIIRLMTHTGMPRIVNNIYLEILAETGIFGFFAFIFMLYSLLKGPLLRIRYMKDRYWDTLLFGLSLGFIGVLTGHLFMSAFYFPYVWVLMGLITATERVAQEQKTYE